MLLLLFLCCTALQRLPLAAGSSNTSTSIGPAANAQKACQLLHASFPDLVAFPDSSQYVADIAHTAVSSQQNSTCSIEPENAEDVSAILRIVGRDDIRAPFAVKGGGHAYNVGFSSTLGVQISMAKFNSVSVGAESQTATIGMGLTWDQVYEKLEPFGVMVTGGRIAGVGVAGLSLGGGYSWKTQQFGLTIDTIVAYDIVLPSGEITHVTNNTLPDLFFALKGGLNNFGIVTGITYKTHPQTSVFAGTIVYAQNATDIITNATAIYDLTNTDPKAEIITTYFYLGGESIISLILFYDAPTVPSGLFDKFLNTPSIEFDVKTRSFVDFIVNSIGTGDLGIGPYAIAQHAIPVVKYTVPILEAIAEQVLNIGTELTARFPDTIFAVNGAAEPFYKPFAHSRGGAYPHPPSRQVTPASPYVQYQAAAAPGEAMYEVVVQALMNLTTTVHAVAIEQGQSSADDLLYPNYAFATTPLQLMYGQNVPILNELANKYDPRGVMQLTGGFKFGR